MLNVRQLNSNSDYLLNNFFGKGELGGCVDC